MKRRQFIRKAGMGALVAGTSLVPGWAAAAGLLKPEVEKLTILHTNDVHSRLDPFPMDGGRYQGMGGAARRATLLRKIREEEEHVLLLDAGDIFQGTPYFNFFNGELEMKLMSQMRYDAATLGNHDFDGGIDGFHQQMGHANFPFVICNYDLSDTILHQKTKPYQVFEKGAMRIGVLGVGIKLEGLVLPSLYKNTRYLDPIEEANKNAAILKRELNCDYVICLSHLGFRYRSGRVSDHTLAENSRDIDLIIGGHTHTFLKEPVELANAVGKPVIINQVGFGGIWLGRLDVYFSKRRKGFLSKGGVVLVGE